MVHLGVLAPPEPKASRVVQVLKGKSAMTVHLGRQDCLVRSVQLVLSAQPVVRDSMVKTVKRVFLALAD